MDYPTKEHGYTRCRTGIKRVPMTKEDRDYLNKWMDEIQQDIKKINKEREEKSIDSHVE